jgi:hypothetical protein
MGWKNDYLWQNEKKWEQNVHDRFQGIYIVSENIHENFC